MSEAVYTVGAIGYDHTFADVTGLFLPALLQAARLTPGQHVLDVATGTGVAAQAAAAIVGPSGSVVAGDISPAMLDVAQRKLREARVTLDTLDAHALPYADERFNAVICQLGLMLFSDPVRALAEFRRVLRPDGRVAVSVSTRPERTLYLRISAAIARHVPSKASTISRYFDIADGGRLGALLAEAGFRDVEIESECRELRFASFDEYFSDIEKGATLSGQEYVCLPENVRSLVREDVRRDLLVERPDEPLTIDLLVLIGSGRR